MDWLNYHHLLYFWTVAREGGVSKAAARLRLSQPTISAQIRLLEEAVGSRLFERQGRRRVMTDMGRTDYRYADEIFGIGRELKETLRGQAPGRPLQLMVGVANAVPIQIIELCAADGHEGIARTRERQVVQPAVELVHARELDVVGRPD